jgi:hypothetical protein
MSRNDPSLELGDEDISARRRYLGESREEVAARSGGEPVSLMWRPRQLILKILRHLIFKMTATSRVFRMLRMITGIGLNRSDLVAKLQQRSRIQRIRTTRPSDRSSTIPG